MQTRQHPTIAKGMVVQYRDTFDQRFIPSYIIDVSRDAIHVIQASIYGPPSAAAFSKAMKCAMAQMEHLKTSQIPMEH